MAFLNAAPYPPSDHSAVVPGNDLADNAAPYPPSDHSAVVPGKDLADNAALYPLLNDGDKVVPGKDWDDAIRHFKVLGKNKELKAYDKKNIGKGIGTVVDRDRVDRDRVDRDITGKNDVTVVWDGGDGTKYKYRYGGTNKDANKYDVQLQDTLISAP